MKNKQNNHNLTSRDKATMCEMKNILDGIDSILDLTEEKINKFEHIAVVTIQNQTKKKWEFYPIPCLDSIVWKQVISSTPLMGRALNRAW